MQEILQKKPYCKPIVLGHEQITFETLLSCKPPNDPGLNLDNGQMVCLKPDGTYFPR